MKVYIGPYKDDCSDRDISVEIHEYDSWSADETLAHIIVPVLKQLKETKHGAPYVDLDDVPKELHPTEDVSEREIGYVDSTHFERWDWVLDEMIWAFEQQLIDWEEQYSTGEADIYSVPVDKDLNEIEDEDAAEYFEMRRGPNDTLVIDFEGLKAHRARMARGTTLFGKYYSSLWD